MFRAEILLLGIQTAAKGPMLLYGIRTQTLKCEHLGAMRLSAAFTIFDGRRPCVLFCAISATRTSSPRQYKWHEHGRRQVREAISPTQVSQLNHELFRHSAGPHSAPRLGGK